VRAARHCAHWWVLFVNVCLGVCAKKLSKFKIHIYQYS
jgi:hypothetical protein